MAALFGTTWREDTSHSSDGRTTTRVREEPAVYPTWLKDLPTAHAWFHGAPIGLTARARRGLLIVAAPAPPDRRARLALPPGRTPAPASASVEAPAAGTPAGPPPTAEELARRAVLRLVGPVRQDGCREWLGSYDRDGYGRVWHRDHRRYAHRLLAIWEYGTFPRSWEVDHTCRHRWCVEVSHLEPIPRAEHRRREAERRHQMDDDADGAVPAATEENGQAPTAPSAPGAPREAATVEQRRAAVQQLRAQGWSLRRIAERLGISHPTVLRDAREAREPGGTGGSGGGTGGTREPPAVAGADGVSEFRPHNGVVRDGRSSAPAAAGESRTLGDTDGTERTGFPIALFARYDSPVVAAHTLDLNDLVDLLSTFETLEDKRQAPCWSPTKYARGVTSRSNAGVEAVSCLVFDCDRVEPDWARLEGYWYVAHTTYQHTAEHPRWRLVLPLAVPVPARHWPQMWRRAHAVLCPEADPVCKDPSRQYYLPSHPPGAQPEARCHEGRLLDPTTLPELPPEPKRPELRLLSPSAVPRDPTERERRRAADYMRKVTEKLAGQPEPGRNNALNHAAWTLGHWVAAGALAQGEVEDALYAAAEQNGLVSDPKDGPRKTWATIRSGLSKGLLRPVDLDADDRPPVQRRRSNRPTKR